MGLSKRKKIVKQGSPDVRVLSCPSIECPMIDCDSDVVDLALIEETGTEVVWYGTCRVCDSHFKLTMQKEA